MTKHPSQTLRLAYGQNACETFGLTSSNERLTWDWNPVVTNWVSRGYQFRGRRHCERARGRRKPAINGKAKNLSIEPYRASFPGGKLHTAVDENDETKAQTGDNNQRKFPIFVTSTAFIGVLRFSFCLPKAKSLHFEPRLSYLKGSPSSRASLGFARLVPTSETFGIPSLFWLGEERPTYGYWHLFPSPLSDMRSSPGNSGSAFGTHRALPALPSGVFGFAGEPSRSSTRRGGRSVIASRAIPGTSRVRATSEGGLAFFWGRRGSWSDV